MSRITATRTTGLGPLWDRLHDADPTTSPFQSRRWALTMRRLGWWRDASMAATFADGMEVLVPSATFLAAPPKVAPILAWPRYWGHGAPLWSATPSPGHVQALLDHLGALPAAIVRLSLGPLNGEAFMDQHPQGWQRTLRRSHLLDLTAGEDVVVKRLDSEIRRRVRVADRKGLEVVRDSRGVLVDELIAVLDATIPRWAEKQHEPIPVARLRARRRDSGRKLHAIAAGMGRDCTIGVARLEGQPVGAYLLLRGRNPEKVLTPVEPVRGLRSHAAQALDVDVLREVCSDGSSVLNLGESDFDGGLSTYKESFGAHPVDHVDLVRERIPVSGAEEALKKAVKRVVGFRE